MFLKKQNKFRILQTFCRSPQKLINEIKQQQPKYIFDTIFPFFGCFIQSFFHPFSASYRWQVSKELRCVLWDPYMKFNAPFSFWWKYVCGNKTWRKYFYDLKWCPMLRRDVMYQCCHIQFIQRILPDVAGERRNFMMFVFIILIKSTHQLFCFHKQLFMAYLTGKLLHKAHS